MKKRLNNDGFTMVECLVAIAILVIIVLAYVGLYETGYVGIYNAGHKSETMYEVQQEVENAVPDPDASDDLPIVFGDKEIKVNGETKTFSDDYAGGRSVSITVFMPND